MNCKECAYFCEVHGCTSLLDDYDGCASGKQFGGHYTHWSNGDYRTCECSNDEEMSKE